MKKLLIISLVLFGLMAGVMGVSAQETAQSVTSSTIAEVNLQPGMRSPHVKQIQEALKALGYFPADLKTTEYLGTKTKEAIVNFQKSHGIPTTGFFGPMTRAALKKALPTQGTVSVSEAAVDTTVDIACMKTAVETRETALLSAYDTHDSAVRAALETRKTDLLAAWSIQDPTERGSAIKVAWDKFRESVKAAKITWKESRKTIWTQFIQDAKNCKASVIESQSSEDVAVTE